MTLMRRFRLLSTDGWMASIVLTPNSPMSPDHMNV
jgi:hypothetical protein